MYPNLRQKYIFLLLIIFSISTFGIVYFARVKDYRGDAGLTVLTAQAIIEHQTLYLDWYKDAYRTGEAIDRRYYVNFDTDSKIVRRNGHYYHYSIGTGIFSLPFVWVANLMGKHMVVPEHEFAIQNLISALLTSLVFVIIYHTSRCYLDPISSLVISVISVLGSSIISVLGVALWNHNFAVFFNSLVLLHLARYESGKIKAINPFWLSLFLFSAYFSRPTAGFLIIAVFAYIFLKNRTFFLKVAVISSLAFLAFIVFSWLRGGEWLPAYYSPLKILPNLYNPSTWLTGLYGNLLSPSRGLLIFSPYLILVVVASGWFFHRLKKYDLFWLCLIWLCLHLAAISIRTNWWGGAAYGPRFSTDVVPGLALITILLWREISQVVELRPKRLLVTAYILLGLFGIFVHSYQGLYNDYTRQWDRVANPVAYLFSWRYPQFLASKESLGQRNLEYRQNVMSTYSFGDRITHTGEVLKFVDDAYIGSNALFWDWYVSEIDWRWSKGESPRIAFKLGDIDPHNEYAVEVVSASLKAQEVGVFLNGRNIGDLTLLPFNGTTPETNTLNFAGVLLKENELNEIVFNLPGALNTDAWESRVEGMAFVFLRIYPQIERQDGVYYFESEFFKDGFSSVEENWRWTDNITSTMVYPFDDIDINQEYQIEILAGALGVQNVRVVVNDISVGQLTFEGAQPHTQTLTFKGSLLNTNHPNQIRFLIPNATIPEDDSRRLGLALVSLAIKPVE